MYKVRIRYNTKVSEGSDLHWRVLIDGKEQLASFVKLHLPTYTTKELVDGIEKWHIACDANRIEWNETACNIY
jgi:hypothetical protein